MPGLGTLLGGQARFVEGFLLAVKSLLDGFAMLAFASYLGWGVAAAGLAVLATGVVAAVRP
jgi:uncharacterized membrane protein YqgA involved in biofilm formation